MNWYFLYCNYYKYWDSAKINIIYYIITYFRQINFFVKFYSNKLIKFKCLLKRILRYWFWNIIIHTNFITLSFSFDINICCASNYNRRINIICFNKLLYYLCSCEPIHNRHINIHENKLVTSVITTTFNLCFLFNLINTFLSIKGRIRQSDSKLFHHHR